MLVKIDDRIYQQKLAQAEATLASQKAALANSHQQEVSAKANITSSEAAVASAQAALTQASLASERQQNLNRSGVGTTSVQEQAEAAYEKGESRSSAGAGCAGGLAPAIADDCCESRLS